MSLKPLTKEQIEAEVAALERHLTEHGVVTARRLQEAEQVKAQIAERKTALVAFGRPTK